MIRTRKRSHTGVRGLEKKLGYRFKKKEYLEKALTHRSFRFEKEGVDDDNQRLEFLGDAVLGFLSAALLYKRHSDKDEGKLTAMRSRVTRGRNLAELAKDIGLGDCLLMGKGEENSGGRSRPSNLMDALEAVIGAAYLDGGIRAAEKVFRKVFSPGMESIDDDKGESNPKGLLQEHAQKRWKKGPQYTLVSRKGPAHAAVFNVKVRLADGTEAKGRGRSKRAAEENAAREALAMISGKHREN